MIGGCGLSFERSIGCFGLGTTRLLGRGARLCAERFSWCFASIYLWLSTILPFISMRADYYFTGSPSTVM